jgi:hypothetical protein
MGRVHDGPSRPPRAPGPGDSVPWRDQMPATSVGAEFFDVRVKGLPIRESARQAEPTAEVEGFPGGWGSAATVPGVAP